MKVEINGKKMYIRAVWLDDAESGTVKMIDQRYIPWRLKFFVSHSVEDTYYAIKNFVVRGAPTIGATAALGMYQAVIEAISSKNFIEVFMDKASYLKKSRPTAYNLFHAVNSVSSFVQKLHDEGVLIEEIKEKAKEFVEKYIEKGLEQCRRIGEYGEELIGDGFKIMTHCNAGAMASVDIGTATAPIYYAYDRGKKVTVYVTETRPWLQGARITAWEIQQYGIDCYVITDNAAGYMMWRGEIDMIIVGADRIAINGDTANKIGTYKLALAAKDNGVPFYVAAPTSTIDPHIKSGNDIPIEERAEEEVHYVRGETKDGNLTEVRITPIGAKARNPVFDITPARLITGFITEVGILKPDEIRKLFE